jgi:hypothetical protein
MGIVIAGKGKGGRYKGYLTSQRDSGVDLDIRHCHTFTLSLGMNRTHDDGLGIGTDIRRSPIT